MTIEHSYGTEVSPGQWYRAELRFTQDASVRTDRNGAVLAESERSVADALIVLTWAEGWQIDAVDVTAVAG